ncbi:MAG: efflux RND transporter permease subunit [Candidatus Omnitrophica bacterium]|jgi:HAE1 family hydrophobic/amphiphilic exporter-1|nr:efflux RND transporter permease subunit [Candidatus Omnitrophota bacterium]
MNLPDFGVKRPVTNLMIFSAIVILAAYSFSRLGIDMLPEVEPPAITVISSYPGASPEDVEIKVTEELENQLATTPGLEKMTSVSAEGVSLITLKFIWGTNIDEASNDIRDRIDLSKRYLPDIPDEMDNPYVFKFNTANIPIVYLGITAKQTYPELYDMVDKRLGDALRQLPGVGTVQIQGGGLERQINIFVDKERLEGYGFSILDIKNVLKKENITQPVGNLKTGLTDYLIRLPGEFTTPDEINLVILGKRSDKVVYLRDVARIEDSFKEVISEVRINKQPGVMLMVQKQSGTNTVEVAQRVKKRLKELEKNFPADVKINTIFDTSKDIMNSINSLKSSVWLAIVLVIFVVWFFLRSAAPSMIVALTIPFSLLISFIYLFLSGKTINTISLSSIAIASGMVVDNAIVVVDNIHRRLERGNRPTEAAIFGTSEMFLAIAASTLTTVVVFMPMLFIPGVVGIMFGELAVIVIVTLVASLFTAATFSPMLCSKWMRVDNGNPKKKMFSWLYEISEKMFKSWENFYGKLLGWSLHHKKTVLLGFVVIFIVSIFLVPFIGNEFMPEEDTGDLRITVSLPIGTRLEETDKVAQKIEEIFQTELPEALFYYARSGQISGLGRLMSQDSGSHVIAAGAKLVPKDKRKRSVFEAAKKVRDKIKNIPGVLKTDVGTGNPIDRLITGTGGKNIQFEIIGHSFEDTDNYAFRVKQILEKIPGAVDVTISRDTNRPELKIEVDREKAGSLGLDMTTISNSLKTFIEGSVATKYREKGETYDIYVRLEEHSRANLQDIENLPIILPRLAEKTQVSKLADLAELKGTVIKPIKLSNVAKIYETTVPDSIERQNRERVVRVEANAYKRSSGKIIEDLKKELDKIALPRDIMINFGGAAEEQRKAFRDLLLLLLLGIALVYMVMAAQFESLFDPFIIMFSIPFTFTGVIWAFFLTGTTLSVITFLGIVMLMGIVVNNAIVLISYIEILRARKFSMYDSITLGGKDRLRPVLMTTITTLVGLLPLAISNGEGSEIWRPLGITMIGGLAVSTLITMLFVPTLYAVFHRKEGRRQIADGR